jgi:hypothetical protein
MPRSPYKPAPRKSDITVIVHRSDETIDIEAWAKRYVRLVIEHDREIQRARAAGATGPIDGATP